LLAAVAVLAGPSFAAAVDPVVATAGDIACAPTHQFFNNGNGSTTYCHQKWTSDLMVNQGLAAVLPLGDNQYVCSGASELAGSYDPSWGRLNSIARPIPGNHEYYTSRGAGCDPTGFALPYFQYFANQLAAVSPSASDPTKGYYSYDIGDWHLIALNTGENCAAVDCRAGSPQEQWLRADLAAHPNVCTLAYFHYPRFSSKTQVTRYTQALWDALYSGGADVVLSGHVHQYERFGPQTPTGAPDAAFGIREFVVGSGGMSLENFSSTIAPNSEVRLKAFGVLKLTLSPTSYSWTFAPDGRNGNVATDSGTANCHGVPGQNDTTPPSVDVTAPTNGATLAGTTPISASADDNVAIQSVQFSIDGNVIATDISAPFVTQWDTTAIGNGTHTVTATATDTAGLQTTSAAVTVTVSNDTTPPNITLDAPTDGATLSTTSTLAATAADDTAVASVRFRVDGTTVATDTTEPFSTSWDSTTVASGAHTVDAVATDTAGNSATSAPAGITVNNVATPPSIEITEPADGATVAGQVPVSADAASTTGITSVAFLADGTSIATDTTAPFSVTWSTAGIPNGAHTLTAVATAGDSQITTSAPVTVTVGNDTTPPHTTVTSPAAGATVSGAITLAATASDETAVQSVDFAVDGQTVGTDTTEPYTAEWASGTVTNGSHTITSIAKDTSNNATTSAPIIVTVANSAPSGIARRAVGTAFGTSGVPTLTIPSTVAAGDVLVAAVTTSSSSATLGTGPAGWTKVVSQKAVDFNSAVYVRVATAGDAGTSAPFPSSLTTNYWTAGIIAYSGADQSSPIVGSSASAPTSQVQSVTPPGVAAPTGAMLVSFAAADVSTGRTWTEDAGSEVFDFQPTNLSLVANDELVGSAATVTRTLTITGAIQELAGYVVVIRPES
jgi:hypothetical protein